MSDDTAISEATTTTSEHPTFTTISSSAEKTITTTTSSETLSADSLSKYESSIQSLSSIISSIPSSSISSSSSSNPALSLLHHHQTASEISSLLRQPDSGAGDNNLCRWLYDTFQSGDPSLQLVVLRFIPIISGVYLSRVPLRKPLAGFEAVLLALYAHETTSRAGQPITVNVPDLSHPSLYHESVAPTKNNATALNLAVISPSLEPHGTVRSTRRARIVGVALELYYSKIYKMPSQSKIEFCEFCRVWAGQDGDNKIEGRIPLPWELMQPMLRILGHCLMSSSCCAKQEDKELLEAAIGACKSLYARSMHDINAKAILATGSLLRLGKIVFEPNDVDHSRIDPTEISMSNVISI